MPYADPAKRRDYKRLQSRQRRAANLDATRKYDREWKRRRYHGDPAERERCIMASRAYRELHRERYYALRRAASYKHKYGMTVQQYDVMFREQNGLCALCGAPPTTRRLHVDHNHRNGKVRGLLCARCNQVLGGVEKRFGSLAKLEAYLKRGE